MKILLATAELHPFSKTGGLADMVSAMGKSLAADGHDVVMMTPLYRGIRGRFADALRQTEYRVDVPMGGGREQAGLAELRLKPNLRVLFVDHPGFYDRPALYGEDNTEYQDNPSRYIFFSKAVAHFARYFPWGPDLVHVHDWQAAVAPVLLKHEGLVSGWNAPPSVLTIHNLAYQGHYAKDRAYGLSNLPEDYFNPGGVEFHGGFNFLKAGIVYSDAITTVSPRYAREICTEEYGCSLDPVLRARREKLTGILNGVDYEEWNTTKNPFLRHPYSLRSLKGKALNKAELQAELGLPQNPDVPIFGSVTRLVDQKGVDIVLGVLEEMLANDLQFVLLGSGDPEIQSAYQRLQERFPHKVHARIGFDLGLSHRIEAGSDFFLMPSRFEPCGLNQIYSLRYGAVPIVRRTGGLDDSVVDPRDDLELADGIKFDEFSVRALSKAVRKALVLFEHREIFERMRGNGMKADFSWQRTSAEYERIYRSVTGMT